MIPQPPPGQGPIDPRGAFSPPGSPPNPNAPVQMNQTGAAGSPGSPFPPGVSPRGGNFGQMPPFPPMMMPPPFYPPPRGGFGKALLTTLLTSIFGFSLLLNVVLIGMLGLNASDELKQVVIQDGNSATKIAVLPIVDVITSRGAVQFRNVLRRIGQDSSIKTIVLEINTPGGEVAASDEIYSAILKYKKEKNVKVVATMGAQATSGGYYIACAADHIFAEPTTLTGNIGVVLQRFNVHGLMEKYGIEDTSVMPTDAKFKNIESPFRPESPETAPYLRGLIDDTFARFKNVVQTGRGAALKGNIDEIADGKAYMANEAKKLGLIDDIGYASDAYAKSAAMNGIAKPHVFWYERTPTLFEQLFGVPTSRGAIRTDFGAVNVNVDRQLIDSLTVPRVMSIYQGH